MWVILAITLAMEGNTPQLRQVILERVFTSEMRCITAKEAMEVGASALPRGLSTKLVCMKAQ